MDIIGKWIRNHQERQAHNDRDYYCIYWWGDRGGYDLDREVCLVCRSSNDPARSGNG